jgi:hypothetical protein
MPRNNAGTYALASGNPVSPNTLISSTWANSTLNDLAAGITDSLSRSGLGGMSQPLKLPDGLSGAPSLTFTAEPTSGMYRADDGVVGLTVLGTVIFSAGDGELLVPQVLHGQKGLTITQAATNTAGTTVTGNGTAAGGVFTGGSSAGNGLTITGGAGNGVGAVITGGSTGRGATIAAGGGNNSGVTATGAGSGAGVAATGGATGNGLTATGGSSGHGLVATGGSSGDGVVASGGGSGRTGGVFTGGAGGAGVIGLAGTAASASVRQTAVAAQQGDIAFTSVTNPNKTVAFANTLTPLNVPKAWARFHTDGLGAVTLEDGFNVSGVAVAGGDVEVTFASGFADTNYVMMGNTFQAFLSVIMNAQTTTIATVRAGTEAGGSIGLNATPATVDVLFFGRQ